LDDRADHIVVVRLWLWLWFDFIQIQLTTIQQPLEDIQYQLRILLHPEIEIDRM